MDVFERIKKLFDSLAVSYEIIEHAPVHTSEEAAQIRDTTLDMGAKALVLFADKTPILVVVPGDKKVDFKKFKQEFQVKDLRFATPDQVEDLTGIKIGSIPPVGKALNLESYYDSSFLVKNMVSFNAGLHTVSIKMNSKDLIEVEEPIIADIT